MAAALGGRGVGSQCPRGCTQPPPELRGRGRLWIPPQHAHAAPDQGTMFSVSPCLPGLWALGFAGTRPPPRIILASPGGLPVLTEVEQLSQRRTKPDLTPHLPVKTPGESCLHQQPGLCRPGNRQRAWALPAFLGVLSWGGGAGSRSQSCKDPGVDCCPASAAVTREAGLAACAPSPQPL